MLNIIGVKVGDKYYITRFDPDSHYGQYSSLAKMKINGELPKPSFDHNWSIVDEEPKKVEIEKPLSYTNYRYELIDKEMASDKIPLVIPKERVTKSLYDDEWIDEYSHLQSLYTLERDIEPATYEEVDFQYETILISFDFGDLKYPEKVEYTKNVKFTQIAQILYPQVVLPNTPCSLTVKDSYDIIRNYIKLNIDPRYAVITSDYDFCFTVKKKIELATPTEYTIDVNKFSFRKKKPKYETRYRTHNEIEVFEMAPAPYQNYTVIKPFAAPNQAELEKTVEKYLKDLMKKINEPLKYCKECGGTGVILDAN